MGWHKIVCLWVAVLLLGLPAVAQKTRVTGTVTDGATGEPLPFAYVGFKNTKIGTSTDLDGRYELESYYASDSLIVTSVGFANQVLSVKLDVSQVIDVVMTAGTLELEAAVIKPSEDENPAHPIMRGVLRNKPINDREKLEAYEYELYNKVEFDLNNITDEFMQRKIFRSVDFVFDNVDSTDEKPYLPVFMTESLSNFYYRKQPKTEKEIIHATRVSGVKNQSVSQFLGDMYQGVNIYDNNIIVFGKSFVSPLSKTGFGFYKYFLMDSTYIDNKWCYLIKFQPRRKQELTFEGEVWVNDTTYAVKQVQATIAADANINWIQDLRFKQYFQEVEEEVWMIERDELVVDFNVTDRNGMGFYGRKTTTYSDFVINTPRKDEFYSGLTDVIVADDASDKEAAFWEEHRHIELTENERSVYAMVDSIQTIPQFRTVADIISLFVSGYKVVGKFEIGPYYTLYSFNPVEGNRFRFGGRTSNEFSTRVMLEGYAAYGLRDRRFKYGGGLWYMISKQPRMLLYASAKKDVEQLGQADGAFREDNVLSSLFRRNPADKLTDVIEYQALLEREWFYGLQNRLIFTHRQLSANPLGSLEYKRFNDADILVDVPSIQTSELTFYTRFAYKEKFLSGEFERVSLGTKYPTLEIAATYGLPNVFGSDYEYQKLRVRVSDKVRLGPFGYIRLRTEAGQIWGQLPYPLLQLHQGNETFFYDESAFNTMNFFEFVSDRWVSASATYHLEGLFLNKVPVFRRLKWREVVSAKGVLGDFDPRNEELLLLNPPDEEVLIHTLSRPFVEAAIGIENIFKVLRIDALYRLSYLDHPNIVRFGIRAKLQVDF